MKKLLYFVLFAGLTIGFTAQTADLELKVKTYSNKMFQYFKQNELHKIGAVLEDARKNGVNLINAQDELGETLFYKACINNHLHMASVCSGYPKFDPNIKNFKGYSPLRAIITLLYKLPQPDYTALFNLLINLPTIDINQQTDGCTLLINLIYRMLTRQVGTREERYQRIIEFVQKNPNLSIQDKKSGLTAFSAFCNIVENFSHKKTQEIIHLFLSKNPELFINQKDIFDCNLLHNIASKDLSEMDINFLVPLLITHGINVNSQDVYGQSALMLAIESKNLLFINLILNYAETNFEIIDTDGNNALMVAAINYNEPIYDTINKFFQKHYPKGFTVKNKEGLTSKQLLPDYIKIASQLITEEGKKKKSEKKNQKAAKLQEAQIERLREAERSLEQVNETLAAQEKKEKEQAQAYRSGQDEQTTERDFFIAYTKACNRWAYFLRSPDHPAIKQQLMKDGYLSDPSTEENAIRRKRAEIFKKLNTIHDGDQAKTTREIIKNHGIMPKIVDRLILTHHPTAKSPVTERTEIKLIVPVEFQNDFDIKKGHYELFFEKNQSGNFSVFHRLLIETSTESISKSKGSKAINVKSKHQKADTAQSADSQALMDQAAASDDVFEHVGQFNVESQLTKSKKNTIYTITDFSNNNTYKITIPIS